MRNTDRGIHHISIISGDGQRNANFYIKALGLRMMIKTVNQDDPSNYHLFYTNGSGKPGSSITFFPWPMAKLGKHGSGEATTVSFVVPSESMGYWAERFGAKGINFDGPFERFGKQLMGFQDPDRLQLELVFDPEINNLKKWTGSTVPEEHGIRGFWGTTMRLTETEETANILESVFGFEEKATEENATLYQTGSEIGNSVILEQVEPKDGRSGRGTVHHVAFRATDRKKLQQMRQQVLDLGLSPTEIVNRHFFRSVYFKSPGGVLFEIATDGPGYKAVQDEEDLGQALYLPDWLESRRDMIEKRLPPITV
ncbi:VOC family protein [Fodinibius halophilus]|uniref:Ring-cleaving dioxygenase n=1 Tax=Fodinibius halophilus TaxID=1736908 RepID=A0A6M1TB73_9BACT|nr:VOC family protein [Fodinibius halophilus]NGP89271.1 ring-cleaving dioxygenase [Fodinibius halophilus]